MTIDIGFILQMINIEWYKLYNIYGLLYVYIWDKFYIYIYIYAHNIHTQIVYYKIKKEKNTSL